MNLKSLQRKAGNRPIFERHILLCTGSRGVENGACCDAEIGAQTLRHLNKRLTQLKKEGRHFYLTTTDCLRFCIGGPLMIVYPEGVWYGGVTVEVCERIIQQHLLRGEIVEEFAFHRNALVKIETK